ncbi:HPF/RaiA family ribosome-associated protein [Candidatus Woesearchaeota archaeon]|nr:HPF/RaiA family ribosome-associated protein [Candidatus Woesearchaeota archaeon]
MNDALSNVQLAGFRDVDSSSMDVLRKVISTHSKRLSELAKKIDAIHITLKPIHEREKSEKYEVHAKIIDNGKAYVSKATDRSLFTAVDDALKKLVNELD